MANLTATMSAAVHCLGASPPDQWQAYNWNAFLWGAGTAKVPTLVRKAVDPQSIASTMVTDYRLVRLLAAQSVVPAAVVNVQVARLLAGQSIGASDSLAHEYLQDPEGYYHVFPEQVTDFVLSTRPTWTAATSIPVAWTTYVVTATVWS